MLKIIHGADFHLDSPFSGLSPQRAAQRRSEQRALLTRLGALAAERGADILLLSGDLFDGERIFRETAQMLSKTLGEMKIPVFISPGNHDYYSPRSPYATLDWPENVHIFRGEEVEAVPLPALGCTVYGAAFTAPVCARPLLAEGTLPPPGGAGDTRLMVLHGDTQGGESYNPISREEMAQSGLHYLALGHVHRGSGLQRAGGTRWAYPGCPEGRGFDETGEKGVLYLELEGEALSCEFVPLCARRYEILEVDLTGTQDAEGTVLAALPPEHGDDIYRILLTGEWEGALPLAQLQRRLAPGFFGLELRDRTRAPQRLWRRAGEDSLAGLFLEEIARLRREGSEGDGGDTTELAVRFGMAALEHGEDVAQ